MQVCGVYMCHVIFMAENQSNYFHFKSDNKAKQEHSVNLILKEKIVWKLKLKTQQLV